MSCLVSLMFMLTWGIDILFEKLTAKIRVEFEKHSLRTMPEGLEISCKTCVQF